MSNSEIRIWYLLVNQDGTPYQNSDTDKIVISSSADISDFRDAVKARNNEDLLKNKSISSLRVYKNFDGLTKQERLEADLLLVDVVGSNMERKDALFVLVPQPELLDPGRDSQVFTFENRHFLDRTTSDENNIVEQILQNILVGSNGKLAIKTASEENLNIASANDSFISNKSKIINFDIPINENVKQSEHVLGELELYQHLADDLKQVGQILPYERLPRSFFSPLAVTVLLGCSGVGKTKTAMDIAMAHSTVYVDFADHIDIHLAFDSFDSDTVDIYGNRNERRLKTYLEYFFFTRISCLLFICSRLEEKNPVSLRYKLASYQRSNSFLKASRNALSLLLRTIPVQKLQPLMDFYLLQWRNLFHDETEGPYFIGDESNVLMFKFENYFQSITSRERVPVLSPFVRYIRSSTLFHCSFWCGTALELVDCTRIALGAGMKKADVNLFTDFNYYIYDDIYRLLKVWIKQSYWEKLASTNGDQISRACYFLQGRPRFISKFVSELCNITTVIDVQANDICNMFEEKLNIYITRNTREYHFKRSLLYYWKEYGISTQKVLSGFTEEPGQLLKKTTSQYLFQLLREYLLNSNPENSGGIGLGSGEIDLVNTALVRIVKSETSGDTFVYSICEPLVMEAGIEMLQNNSQLKLEFLKSTAACDQYTNSGLTPQSRGNGFEKFIGLQCRLEWWKFALKDEKLWRMLREENTLWGLLFNAMKGFEKAYYIFNQDSFIENDVALEVLSCAKFNWLVFPYVYLGPDCVHPPAAYYMKTSHFPDKSGKISVSRGALARNSYYVDTKNWVSSKPSTSTKRRKVSLKPALKDLKLVHFYLEFPEPKDEQPQISTNDEGELVVHLSETSKLTKYLIPLDILTDWRENLKGTL